MNVLARTLATALLLFTGTNAVAQESVDTAVNILVNPSFELHDPIKRNRSRLFSEIPGWRAAAQHIEIHDRNSGQIHAYDGRSKLDLDAPLNARVVQEIATSFGQRYRLELFYAPRATRRGTDSNDFSLDWNGERVDDVGGDQRYWRRHIFDLQADADLSILSLNGAGRSDGYGALIDALTLTASAYASGNLIVNGSFEQSDSFGHKHRRLFNDIPGWTASRGAIGLFRHGTAGVLPYEGQTLMSLDGRYRDTVTQALVLSAGRSYDLQLEFSPRRSDWVDKIEVLVNGELVDSVDGRDKVWHRRRWSLLAQADEVELTVRAPGRGQRHDDDEHDDDHGSDHDDDDGDDDDDDDDQDKNKDDDDDRAPSNKGGLVDNIRLYQTCRASGNLLTNHSFERYERLRDHDHGSFLTIPGWRATQGKIEIYRYGGLMAAEGHSHIELGGSANTAVVQDLLTVPGARYEVLFAYSPRVDESGAHQNDADVLWNGEVLKTLSSDTPGWQFHRVEVTATAEQAELSFFGARSRYGKGGALIDEARVFRIDAVEFTSEPVSDALVGTAYQYAPSVSVDDAPGVSFALTGAADGMSIDAATGQITWDEPVEGEYALELIARNACGDISVQGFTLVVVGSRNQPPLIFSTPVTTTEIFTLRPLVTVTDANPGTQLIELNGAPISSGHRITEDGAYTLRVLATDRAGNSAEQVIQFTIDRSATP